jgi:hypothetical protein
MKNDSSWHRTPDRCATNYTDCNTNYMLHTFEPLRHGDTEKNNLETQTWCLVVIFLCNIYLTITELQGFREEAKIK